MAFSSTLQYKVVGFTQVFNEIRKNNLHRFISHIKPYITDLVVYDDGSTDGSYELLSTVTPYIIRGARNDFTNEIFHKQKLLELALSLNPDFILWLDIDEVLSKNTDINSLCNFVNTHNFDGLALREINFWRSNRYKRTDSLYADGMFVRLWKVRPGMKYECESGLHCKQYPSTITNIVYIEDIQYGCVLHYGFSDYNNLAHKFFTYRKNGQSGYNLYRLIMEEEDREICEGAFDLKVELVEEYLIPDDLLNGESGGSSMVESGNAPIPVPFHTAFKNISLYRDLVDKPTTTFICLIYKSVSWLKFFYKQFLKYTPISGCEFYFVANDAVPEVIEYLQDNRIPHYNYNNTEEQRKEWYINNVYRAWNYGIKQAKGDYIVLLNSDMAFSPNWYENLFVKLRYNNCVCSRLVESTRYPSGQYGIGMNFGMKINEYNEEGFLNYVNEISENRVDNGGLYMPLLIRKNDIERVGMYPEGNLVPGTENVYAKQGEACISGDYVLMRRLEGLGIIQQTVFNSIVYHFQEGEMRDLTKDEGVDTNFNNMLICNDYVRGMNGEKVLWNWLIELSNNNFGISTADPSSTPAPSSGTGLVLQNASFMDLVDIGAKKIAYLQDNFRKMNYSEYLLNQQLNNLKNCQVKFTNSIECASYYPEFDFTILPIGVDSELFRPMSREFVRTKHGIKEGKVGIFVGEFTEIKGWPDIKRLIERRQDIYWIIVSKNMGDEFLGVNCRMYNKVGQGTLVELLNCADFFILGSKTETLCLAAIEALMCNIPVIMNNTGVFYTMDNEKKSKCGVIYDGVIEDFDRIVNMLDDKDPRNNIMEYDIRNVMEKWRWELGKVQLVTDSREFYRG